MPKGLFESLFLDSFPPFWEQGGFYAVSISLLVIIVVLLILLRSTNSKKRAIKQPGRSDSNTLSVQKEHFEALSLVASEMTDAVIIFEGNGEIQWVNKGFTVMTGYELSEYISLYGSNIYEISDSPDIEALKAKTIDPKFLKYDFVHFTKDGEEKWNTCTLTPLKGPNGEYNKFICIYADITERKNFEVKLKQRNKNITDSIRYAKKIQEAILPDPVLLFKNFNEAFIFYKPRDIVSGDFYWFSRIGPYFVVAAADCTGHGVPGAMMSMMGNEFLHQIVNNSEITGPEQALFTLDKMIKRALHQDGVARESKDGMDIAMAAIHMDSLWCQFAGAFNPLYLIRDGELQQFDAAKESIGGYSAKEKGFFSHEFDLKSGDVIYLFTDGFVDQFGGEKGRKFMRSRFRKLLVEIHKEPMAVQQLRMEKEYSNWRGNYKQVDDVLVMGIKVP